MSLTSTGMAGRLLEHDVVDVVDLVDQADRRRTLADCWPRLSVRPPTLMLELPTAVRTCWQGQIVGREFVEVDVDVVFLVGSAPSSPR